ncbi:MAG TPA: hypothetical protein V6D11_11745 [Waterburya sp.]
MKTFSFLQGFITITGVAVLSADIVPLCLCRWHQKNGENAP